MKPNHIGATGLAAKYLPPGDEAEEILSLIRLGVKFQGQHTGRKPGTISRLVLLSAEKIGPPYSFNLLIAELERSAARRELNGVSASPVEKVDRIWELVTIHDTKNGRYQVPFSTLRNHLTNAKKIINAR
ncbi:MAG: hypothetical protein Q7U82_12915 [Gammaproteobacteria bacterium]|nr:hypothetical protein [Gammaproteobacteria bacterium]